VSKDVRILGYLTKPEGVHGQKILVNTGIGCFYFYPTDAQLNIPRRMLKFTLKLTLKVRLHVLV
jgi:hypothetical protein